MVNLLAYIPVLNQRHLDWFKNYPEGHLHLISQKLAEAFVPRLSRNMVAIETEMVARMIRSEGLVQDISLFWPDHNDPACESIWWNSWVVANEDVSCLVAEKYLIPSGVGCRFQTIWARWDMSAVHREQPIMADVTVSQSVVDNQFVVLAERETVKSPDWWRQIGAVLIGPNGQVLAKAHNTHFPNEYETYIFGDPRLNVDAGEKGKYCSFHAERAVIRSEEDT